MAFVLTQDNSVMAILMHVHSFRFKSRQEFRVFGNVSHFLAFSFLRLPSKSVYWSMMTLITCFLPL